MAYFTEPWWIWVLREKRPEQGRETVVRVSVVLFRPPVCLEGELGQRLPWRAVTSMRRRFMSSMVQPMPVRATAARSMPFVFAPVDAMT